MIDDEYARTAYHPHVEYLLCINYVHSSSHLYSFASPARSNVPVDRLSGFAGELSEGIEDEDLR